MSDTAPTAPKKAPLLLQLDGKLPPRARKSERLRSRSTPPSHRFSEVPARSGDEVGVGVALGVGRGARESPATFFSQPPSSLQPIDVSFPVEIAGPCNGLWFRVVRHDSHSGGCEFSPFRVPVTADFFYSVTKYLCADACALTREGAAKWLRFGLFGSSIRCDSTGI